MKRVSGGIKRLQRHVVIIVVVSLAAALIGFAGIASGGTTKSKTVQAMATIKVAPSTNSSTVDHELFTVGHAMVIGECAGPDPTTGQVLAKLIVRAVGGAVTFANAGADGDGAVLVPGTDHDRDSNTVEIRSPGDTDTHAVGRETIVVLDDNGPSFSGTAGLWIESAPAGPCVFTAQVAG